MIRVHAATGISYAFVLGLILAFVLAFVLALVGQAACLPDFAHQSPQALDLRRQLLAIVL